MIISNPQIVAELVRSHHPQPVLISNPFSKYHFYSLITWFDRLLADPDRNRWMLDPTTHNSGLIRRDPTDKEPLIDPKWMWHYSLQEFWTIVREKNFNTSRYDPFLALCHKTIWIGISSVLPIIRELDIQLPGYAFERNFLAANCLLRLIKDDPPVELKRLEVATPHTNFSFCTMHWYETRPHLLWLEEKTKTWIPVDFNMENQPSVFFLGRKAALMTGGRREIDPDGTHSKRIVERSGILRPLCHRVIEVGEWENLTTSRYAAALFFHVPLVL